MIRTFKETPIFEKNWKDLGLSDEDLRRLQNILLDDPKAGPVIEETGGMRKIRIPFKGQGKRGSGRVLYVDVEITETIHFINVYAKNEKDNLTKEEKKAFKPFVQALKREV